MNQFEWQDKTNGAEQLIAKENGSFDFINEGQDGDLNGHDGEINKNDQKRKREELSNEKVEKEMLKPLGQGFDSSKTSNSQSAIID